MCLAQGPQRSDASEPAAPRSRVKHSPTEPLRSHLCLWDDLPIHWPQYSLNPSGHPLFVIWPTYTLAPVLIKSLWTSTDEASNTVLTQVLTLSIFTLINIWKSVKPRCSKNSMPQHWPMVYHGKVRKRAKIRNRYSQISVIQMLIIRNYWVIQRRRTVPTFFSIIYCNKTTDYSNFDYPKNSIFQSDLLVPVKEIPIKLTFKIRSPKCHAWWSWFLCLVEFDLHTRVI